MVKDHLSRKLAVILHADVVDSTSLVQKNEVIAHNRIQDSFQRFSRVITSYGGIAHEIRGDALVAGFGRASDSVSAALTYQVENAAFNKELSDDIQPEVRIGISLGEVVIADGTITGPGIVLAQRLEQLAEPGGVVVQGSVSDTVPNRLPFSFESLGEQKLKGFDQLVRAFKVKIKPGELIPEPETEDDGQNSDSLANESPDRPVITDTGKPSIAVLPFENMSGDSEQEYFSDGISEDIITELSRFSDLHVIARHSSFLFKNQSIDILEIGEKLGVQYVIEGSVRKSARRVRITAQLIDVATGNQIWADRYDRELEDIFSVQDDVVRIITTTLVGRVGQARRNRAVTKGTSNMNAYDWFVQGRELFHKTTSEENVRACEMFEKVVSLDPGFGAAHAFLAESYIRDWSMYWNEPPESSYDRAWASAKQSLALDDTDSRCQTTVALAYLYSGDHEQAHYRLTKALSLNPCDTHAITYMSRYEMFMGNAERSIELIDEARHFDPFGTYDWSLVTAYFVAHNYDEAIHFMRAIQNPPPIMSICMAAIYAQAGEIQIATELATKYVEKANTKLGSVGTPSPDSWLNFVSQRWPFKHEKDREHFLDGLRKAGVPD